MLDYRRKYIYICGGRYDVRRWSVEKVVMLLPGLEAPEKLRKTTECAIFRAFAAV